MSTIPRLSHGILSLSVTTKDELYQAYMSYIHGGGIFVPTQHSYHLGEEVFMLFELMDEEEKIPVTGRVIWVTPKGAHSRRMPGVGIQLSTDYIPLVNKIETYLAGAMESNRITHAL